MKSALSHRCRQLLLLLSVGFCSSHQRHPMFENAYRSVYRHHRHHRSLHRHSSCGWDTPSRRSHCLLILKHCLHRVRACVYCRSRLRDSLRRQPGEPSCSEPRSPPLMKTAGTRGHPTTRSYRVVVTAERADDSTGHRVVVIIRPAADHYVPDVNPLAACRPRCTFR